MKTVIITPTLMNNFKNKKKNLLITGGLGFIGKNLILFLTANTDYNIVNIDKKSYASNDSIDTPEDRYIHINGDILDQKLLDRLFNDFNFSGVFHLAAESHVDNSISSPEKFIETNVNGTYNLLNSSLKYFNHLKDKEDFKFIHVSTDEVYGSLKLEDKPFTEKSRYDPRSPYSASKASSDHLVSSWMTTYNLPTIITHCSNNYGPFQHVEKLIPMTVSKCLSNNEIPVYGDGSNIRDWIHVKDHVRGLHKVFESGIAGETYNIGSDNEIRNIDLIENICEILDKKNPSLDKKVYKKLIKFVNDRPGHDFRYSIDSSKMKEIGWEPIVNFKDGINDTIEWYLKKIK